MARAANSADICADVAKQVTNGLMVGKSPESGEDKNMTIVLVIFTC